nr:MAG TPA: hypothetical protein [Caudoviricetes sp.]DAX28589.1 MAG TPA: hypothetical protein [Caudoviricetes sp.]
MNIKFKSFHFILLFKVLYDYILSRCLMSLSTTIFILEPPFFAIKKHLVFS